MTQLLALVLLGAPLAYAAGPAAVNLGTAGNFEILAKSGISTVPTSAVTGDIGVSPIDSTAITGFGLIADSSNVFSTSPQVIGKVYSSNYAVPTPANLTTAISDMQTAYTDAASRAPTATELGAGNIGGLTLAPGVYKWGTGVTIPTNLTLAGGPNDVWIFEIAQDLSVSSGQSVILSGGAQAKNVFWQVAGQATLGTTSHLEGTILSQTAIHLLTGASINGGLYAQTAVTLQSNTVNKVTSGSTPVPAPTSTVTPTPTPSPTPSTSSSAGSSSATGTTVSPSSSVTASANPGTTTTAPMTTTVTTVTAANPAQGSVTTTSSATSGGSAQTSDTFKIQQYLNTHGFHVAQSGAGSPGHETSFFGRRTKAAIKAFQEAHSVDILVPLGLTKGTGFLGARTRAYISAHP
jgi:hypothetical protein